MKATDVESLNLSELDVDSLEQRLEMSLLVHPFFYDCHSNSETCNGKVTVAAGGE